MAERQRWAVVPNPGYAGRTPRPLEADCHDRSPFVTVECACGAQGHYHETQVAPAGGREIRGRCQGCGDALVFPPGALPSMFAELRRRGWLA